MAAALVAGAAVDAVAPDAVGAGRVVQAAAAPGVGASPAPVDAVAAKAVVVMEAAVDAAAMRHAKARICSRTSLRSTESPRS